MSERMDLGPNYEMICAGYVSSPGALGLKENWTAAKPSARPKQAGASRRQRRAFRPI